MAQRAGSTTVQFAAASHVGGLTHYAARFVKLIEQAAQATGTWRFECIAIGNLARPRLNFDTQETMVTKLP